MKTLRAIAAASLFCGSLFAADFPPLPNPEPFSGNIPPPVGGMDFWRYDATHVPKSPTRNLMPNPSFE